MDTSLALTQEALTTLARGKARNNVRREWQVAKDSSSATRTRTGNAAGPFQLSAPANLLAISEGGRRAGGPDLPRSGLGYGGTSAGSTIA